MGESYGTQDILSQDIEKRMREDDISVRELCGYLHDIGAQKLAGEILEVHFESRVARHRRDADYYELSLALHDLKEDRLLDDTIKYNVQAVENSVKYNNVVISLGYAGFVALLTLANNISYESDFVFSWFMLAASLVVFVIWNIVLSILVASNASRISYIFKMDGKFDRRDILAQFDFAKRNYDKSTATLHRFWMPVFSFSLVTALLGAGTIVTSIVRKLDDTGSVVDILINFL